MRTKEEGERRAEQVEEMAKTLYVLLPKTKGKEWDDLPRSVQEQAREAAERALDARDSVTPHWLAEETFPRSPREALLMILAEVPQPETGDYLIRRASATMVREIAQYGLRSREEVFSTDTLADRLAQAHDLLVAIEKSSTEAFDTVLLDRFGEVLALPPDLEAMVERRMKLRRG